MKIKSANYTANADSYEKCPPNGKPEFAFIGRSNVGKSSLINALCNHNGLAKVSMKPGKTILINFFTVNDAFHLVDLPGYGFSKVSNKLEEGFINFTAEYLALRESLKCIFVLIDSRHEPQKLDIQFMRWIDQFDKDTVIVFTKRDLVDKQAFTNHLALFKEAMADEGLDMPQYLSCSAKNGMGKMSVFNYIQPNLPKLSKEEVKRRKRAANWMKKV